MRTAGCYIQTVSNNRPVVVNKTRIPKILTPGGGKKAGVGTKGGKEREREKSIWGAFVGL